MKYQVIKLGEIVDIKGGKRLPIGEDLVDYDTGHPYIRARDIRNGLVTFEEPKYITEKVYNKLKNYTVKTGDVCITIVGINVGDVGIIPKQLDGANLTENAVKLTNCKCGSSPTFLKYSLLTRKPQSDMKLFGSGSAQNKLGLYKIKEIEIPYPPSNAQQKIASILSVYDDLIENNNRRIKILEEMAQTIYNEWFVKLRFPGHEKTKMGKSELGEMPEGWEIKGISDVQHWAFINEAIGKYQGKKEYFATANIEGTAIVANGEWVTYEEKPSRAQKEPVIYSVWFARMRDTFKVLGFSAANEDIAKRIILSSGFAGFKTDSSLFPFLYVTINSDKFHEIKNQFCTGATQMSLTNEGLSKIKVMVPSPELIKQYGALALPIIDEMFLLEKKNKIFQQTRDLLLPKLISGELDVENLDIKVDK